MCPNVLVPCIYCRVKVERMHIMTHEQEACVGTYTCGKCGMTIVKEETQKSSHNCFNALAGYLQNMLQSKDYVIQVFKEEIQRKNTLIAELLDKQDRLEQKLTRMETVLAFDKDVTQLPPLPEKPPQEESKEPDSDPESPEPSEGIESVVASIQEAEEA